jgi:aerobic C4-dicarboxylate transport protein
VILAGGIAGAVSMQRLGETALRALAYFLLVSTIALVIGLAVANVVKLGADMHVNPATLDAAAVEGYAGKGHEQSLVPFLMAIIPESFVSAFEERQMLPLLFVAVLFGVAVAKPGALRSQVARATSRRATHSFSMARTST